jgi:5-methylcytosine-specific restriction endonuclease McrA
MPNPGYFRKRRNRLMKENPHCHWCGKTLNLYPDYGTNGFKIMPDDYATIDHLVSRLRGPRKNVSMNARTLVIACPQCNNARNVAEAHQYIWRTRWKSASFPFPLRWFGVLLKRYRHQRRKRILTD